MTSRSITSYSKVRKHYGNFLRGNPLQLASRELNKKEYLNIGCGPNIESTFINVDYLWQPGVDLCWNVTKGIPLPDSSLTGVFSEHCLEHLDYLDAVKVLAECHRLLKPGGVIRIIVPDAELYLDIYRRQKTGLNEGFPYGQTAHDMPESAEITPMMTVNSIFRGHGHLYAYDYYTFEVLLRKQGFINIKRENFRTGQDSMLLIDTASRACESLYVEASKQSR